MRRRLYVSYCPRSNSKLTQYPSGVRKSQQNQYEICGLTAEASFKKTSGFTLLEVILAMAIMLLLAGAIYSISSAAIESTKETIVEQFTMRRLAGFLQITRNAFLNLPANGEIYLSNDSNNTIPDLNFEKATGLFGIASLGGGILTLSALPNSDGTRTFSMLRIPNNIQGNELNHFLEHASWVKLLPKVQKPHWSFFNKREWVDEWPRGSGRPQLVRLQMEVEGIQEPLETIFYVPPISKISFGIPNNVPIQPPKEHGGVNPDISH
ncbi:MAG: GspJ family type II secretion system protein [Chthoniobacterales bacterium]|nr:GspJ family type II secretion system protein [Chthoniobacterales bacterium]